MKRGQISSEVIVYVLTIIIVGAVIVIGYNYFGNSKKLINKSERLQLQSKITSDARSISREYGTFRKITYSLPQNLNEVCFIDLKNKEDVLSSKLIESYPQIKDSISSGSKNNIFFIGTAEQNSYHIDNFGINHYPYMNCFHQKNGKIEVGLEGLGSGNSLILTDFVTSAKISKDATTILESADKIVTLILPKGTTATLPTGNVESINIEMVEPLPDSQNRVSDLYRFNPSGAQFSNPIELKIKYNPVLVGDCPNSLKFVKFKDDGSSKVTIQSKEPIDCKNHIATFMIDSFSIGFVQGIK